MAKRIKLQYFLREKDGMGTPLMDTKELTLAESLKQWLSKSGCSFVVRGAEMDASDVQVFVDEIFDDEDLHNAVDIIYVDLLTPVLVLKAVAFNGCLVYEGQTESLHLEMNEQFDLAIDAHLALKNFPNLSSEQAHFFLKQSTDARGRILELMDSVTPTTPEMRRVFHPSTPRAGSSPVLTPLPETPDSPDSFDWPDATPSKEALKVKESDVLSPDTVELNGRTVEAEEYELSQDMYAIAKLRLQNDPDCGF